MVTASEQQALGHLSDWLAELGVTAPAGSSDDEDLVEDDRARSYLHAIRGQYARQMVKPVRACLGAALRQRRVACDEHRLSGYAYCCCHRVQGVPPCSLARTKRR